MFIFLFIKWDHERDKEKDRKRYYYFNLYKKTFDETNNGGSHWSEHYKKYIKSIKDFNIERKYITLIPDDPISIWKDIFQYDHFVKNIYDIINGINSKDLEWSYSIWVVWEWWLWKSSVINLLDRKYLDNNPNYLVHRFNPWNYEKSDLVKNYLSDLSTVLWKKDITILLSKYLKLVEWFEGVFGFLIKLLTPFIKEKTLEEVKNDIGNELGKLWKKLVIIIDDLDRCEPGEILIMLNLVKNLWNFQNIIYLVSYDKEKIIKVMTDKWFDGEYLDKIINIERFIPIPSGQDLKEFFTTQFEIILKLIQIEDGNTEIIKNILDKFNDIFEKENLRFIKRLINHLNIVLQLNFDNSNWKEKIKKFTKQDFEKIVLINYIKLKDYVFFQESLRKFKNISSIKRYYAPNRPNVFQNLSEKSHYEELLGLIWLEVYNGPANQKWNTEHLTQITNGYFEKTNLYRQLESGELIMEDIKKTEISGIEKEITELEFNLELVRDFS